MTMLTSGSFVSKLQNAGQRVRDDGPGFGIERDRDEGEERGQPELLAEYGNAECAEGDETRRQVDRADQLRAVAINDDIACERHAFGEPVADNPVDRDQDDSRGNQEAGVPEMEDGDVAVVA